MTKIVSIQQPLYEEQDLEVFMCLDYLNHPTISGNKFRKLQFNLEEARRQRKTKLITFGGAFSNHLFAFAHACSLFKFEGIAVIRGDGMDETNPTLKTLQEQNIKMVFVSREAYRDKEQLTKEMQGIYPNSYVIPEGGTNEWALKGFEALVSEIGEGYDVWVSPVGTGGTLAGISTYHTSSKNLGIAVVKDSSLKAQIEGLNPKGNFELIEDYTLGGYAKVPEMLVHFINAFYEKTGIPLDPIYTGKMVYAVEDLIRRDYFTPGQRILMIHTGGLQGIAGFNKLTKGPRINFSIG